MKKYTKTHEWVSLHGTDATIGISNHAQELLGDVVYADLPSVGKTVKKGEILCSLESVKAAAEVFCPVTGTVKEVNNALNDNPEIINQSAETDGWIAKLTISDRSEYESLMDESAYKAFCATHQ
ncbi:MAG TPA: glycine cleavage system protein GcvH [Thermotogota bacterium]|jgi:glycine cleavage system H protein|nr:glycine cleavage system protein GcvH [Thermotogota bacterium]NLH20436.1 glycine cleavage system protein GcvH [Thermotogaceae bacterium]OQC32808.1 MAG: Glycine cleavage system H protein [Thermotogota bacterium ADurb.Bin062]HNW46898.1 glycine cleavage system protein GcvH [Thermotogota bacterium]HOD90228.1 glycine cleavage system protein GcvH [Thermotogota bacterium]